jgi:hypothetical protein
MSSTTSDQIELDASCTRSNVTCGDDNIVMINGDTRSASAGQLALLHGLLRFQIELDNVTCGDDNIVMIDGDSSQCLCWTARTATWAPSLRVRARRPLHMQQRHLKRWQHRHDQW